MLKALLKKQLYEIFGGFFYNKKTGKARSGAGGIAGVVLYVAVIFVAVGGMFAAAANTVCGYLFSAGYGWLYYAMFSAAALVFGVFGSVFSTYSGLYLAKDNEILLSMPVPVRCIIISRLLGVYLMGLMFSAAAMAPPLFVAFTTVPQSLYSVLFGILLMIIVSLIVLFLSCFFGWIVACIRRRLKNKGMLTALVSLIFIAVYYFVYFKAWNIVENITKNAELLALGMKESAYPLYLLGKMGAGDLASTVVVVPSVIALCIAVCAVLAKSFMKTVASVAGTSGKKRISTYVYKQKSAFSALFVKELSMFKSSANYMLNSALGVVFLLIASGFVITKGRDFSVVLTEIFGNDGLWEIIIIALVSMLALTNCITAPSVSLEGKRIWIPKSLPVRAWDVLKAKILLHISVCGIPTLLCGFCAMLAFSESPLTLRVFMVLIPLQCMLLSASFGIFVNLRHPNLTWTNEVVPIKQSLSVFLVLFLGWIYAGAMALGYFAVYGILSAELYMTVIFALTLLLTGALLLYMKKRGAKIFSEL